MNKFNSIISIAFTLIFLSCQKDPQVVPGSYDCHTPTQNSHPNETMFDDFLQEKVEEGLVGISMLIKTPDGLYSGSAGVADIPGKHQMLPCAVHRVGSITKQFTAAVIMLLREKNQLNLTDSVKTYLDSKTLKNLANAENATIHQLLTHTSGIPDVYEIDYWLEFFNNPVKVLGAEEELRFARNSDASFTAGEFWQYSNTNYLLLELIAEKVTGQTLENLYTEFIFTPLGLTSTYFSQKGIRPDNLVRCYIDEFENGYLKDVTEYAFGVANGTGGLYSNTFDMLTFHESFLEPNKLFKKESLDLMLSPIDVPFYNPDPLNYGAEYKVNKINGYGLGWIEMDTDIGKVYGHNGGAVGRKARAWYFPKQKSHIIYFFNSSGGKAEEISKELHRNEMIDLITS